jgi:hypothetical protein
MAGNLCLEVGARPPDFVPERSVYFLTLLDQRQIVYPTRGEDESPTLEEIRKSYARLLRGLNYIGMLDPALYVSAHRTHHVARFIHFHVHVLVWGVRRAELERRCKEIRVQIGSLIRRATPAKYKPVKDRTLLKVTSYTAKMPRHQYQIWSELHKPGMKQSKRRINGVNSVRLYGAMQDYTLDQLVLAGGRGERVLKHMLRDLHEWQLLHTDAAATRARRQLDRDTGLRLAGASP